MRRREFLTVAALAICVMSTSVLAGNIVVNFDDLEPGINFVPDGYGGIASWGSWSSYDFDQDPYNPSSGMHRIFDTLKIPTPIEFGTDYIFEGAWFAGLDSGDVNGGDIVMDLYNDNHLVHTSAIIAPNDVPTFLASGYAGIVDEIRFRAVIGDYGYFIIDDFTYQIPAPGALALLGIAGLATRRRRRVA